MSDTLNPPAFPSQPVTSTGEPNEPCMGMTLRDYFAGQAVIGLLAGQHRDSGRHNLDPTGLPSEAYHIADAMLAAREVTT